MAELFRYRRRVEFRDTDAAGIVHFSVYFNYMENAEHALLRAAGTSVFERDEQGVISWPRVSAHCDFAGALRFEDEVEIEVSVAKLGEKSVRFGFQFRRDGRPVAKGTLTAVCCRVHEHGKLESISIPATIRDQLATYQCTEPSTTE